MKKVLVAMMFVLGAGMLMLQKDTSNSVQKKTPGAFHALVHWNDARAYPNEEFPSTGYYDAFQEMKSQTNQSKTTETEWEAIGPNNTAGRALDIAIDPTNGNNVWVGTASGGLWKTSSGGIGVNAWKYVETGLPALGVSAIALAPTDPSIIYAGTGEVYNHGQVGNGAAYRETRGSYGIGILKSNNGGQSWGLTLDWSGDQGSGVNDIKIDSENASIVWAGTTEGVYRSTNGGTSWNLILDKKMVTDLVLVPGTETVITVAGNLGHPDQGIYRSTNNGATWSKINSGLPESFNGKGQLAISPSNPDVIYASIGENFWSTFPSDPGITWLCKSTDAGATWSIVNTTDYAQWQGWFSHDVVVDPNDSDHIYVIGIHIWESTDGGNTLTQKSEGGVTLGVPVAGQPDGDDLYSHSDHHDVKIDPNDPDRIFFANDGGVFFSGDGANTFRSVNGGLQTTQFYQGFSSSPVDPNFSAGGLQDNSSVLYTGSGEWRRVVGGDGSWTAMSPEDPDVVYVSWQFLNIRKSVTKGIDLPDTESDNWQNVSPPINVSSAPPNDVLNTDDYLATTSFIAPYVLCPSNPNVMYAGRDKIYKSTDGGSSWSSTNNFQEINGNPAYAMAASIQNEDKMYLSTIPRDQSTTMHVTQDGADSFTEITAGLPDRYFMDIAVDPFDDSIVYVCIGGFGTDHLFKSFDSGSTWVNVGDNLPDVPTNAVVVDPNNNDHVYVGNDLGVFFSQDGGESFDPWNEGLFTDAVLVIDLSISPVNQKIRIASHGNGSFQRDLVSSELESGIADQANGLVLFPNPSQGDVYIRNLDHASSFTLHKLNGVQVKRGTVLPGEAIEVDHLPSAHYLLRLKDTSGNWRSLKLVKH